MVIPIDEDALSYVIATFLYIIDDVVTLSWQLFQRYVNVLPNMHILHKYVSKRSRLFAA